MPRLPCGPARSVVVAEGGVAISDRSLHGRRCRLDTARTLPFASKAVDAASIEDLIGDQVAVVLVNHVNYKIRRAARHGGDDAAGSTEAGALVIWDLCHSAGALPVDLDGGQCRFRCWLHL